MSDWRKANGRIHPWNVKYFGVGNEAWGCGGNMTAEYYCNIYKQYATFMADWGNSKHLFRVASGANGDDYHWTEVMMRELWYLCYGTGAGSNADRLGRPLYDSCLAIDRGLRRGLRTNPSCSSRQERKPAGRPSKSRTRSCQTDRVQFTAGASSSRPRCNSFRKRRYRGSSEGIQGLGVSYPLN